MSSQFLSIFFLSEIDHKIVHVYHLKYYVRYMDDFLIFSEDREYLKKIKEEIESELKNRYKLEINEKKTFITNIRQGVNFCGYRFRVINGKTIINVVRDTRERVKRQIKEVGYLYRNDKISSSRAFSCISTYLEGFKYGSRARMRRLVDRYFWGKFDE